MLKINPLLLLFTVLTLFAGCSSSPRAPEPVAEKSLSLQAAMLAERGDYPAAAQLYLTKAKSAPAAQRDHLRLLAVGYLAQAQHWEQVEKLLASISKAALPRDEQQSLLIVQAQLALQQKQPEQILSRLQHIREPDMLPDQGQLFYQLKARAYAMQGNALESSRQLIWLDGLLSGQAEKLKNQQTIWEQLSTLSDQALERLRTNPPPNTMSGWMELITISRQSRSDPRQWLTTLDEWRQRYPNHASEQAWLPFLNNKVSQAGIRTGHIGILLPLSGRTTESASAIRDGILAAWFSQPGDKPELHFYDSAGNAQLIWSLYQQAINDGAEMVIGPLLKDRILELSRSGELPIKVLALNQTDAERSADLPLYQFGLSPEDEARQVADKIRADGHQRIIAFYPDTQWGQRVYSAFKKRFTLLDGEILTSADYAANNQDFKQPIQNTMNLNSSQQRYKAMTRLLGQKLQYEPRRRQDVDAIFMLAFPAQARQLYPQLRFHHAGDIPVYSTSHVYSGTIDNTQDRDMNGLLFCDMPWVLQAKMDWRQEHVDIHKSWPDRSEQYQRLFALGVDAYQVSPWLETLNTPGFKFFPGATGTLSIDQNRDLHRTLEWARFKGGIPKLQEPNILAD